MEMFLREHKTLNCIFLAPGLAHTRENIYELFLFWLIDLETSAVAVEKITFYLYAFSTERSAYHYLCTVHANDRRCFC